ncbi:MAG: hypothetical protein WDN26_11835 [Chitinophagaceae bacterium]
MPSLPIQLTWLFTLALPVACISWTVTREEIFREFNDFCHKKSETNKWIFTRKLFYLFTCEYCFSHYITLLILLLSRYTLLLPGWRGYILAGFSIVWISNFYMSIYSRIRISLKKERIESKLGEKKLEEKNKAAE